MMQKYLIKRTIFLTPLKKTEGNKSLVPMPNRVVLKKGDVFEGTLKPSTIPNVDSILSFEYNGFVFEKPYGGTDNYARMNKQDMPLFGTPEAVLITPPNARPLPLNDKPTPIMETSKATSGTSIFEFKDKLHAGVTLVGVAFGIYYAYKTKASIPKYIGFALGAGAVGFILGGVASAYVMQTPVKQAKEDSAVPEGAKPAFDGVYANGMSVEEDTMEKQMNSIL